MKNNRIFRSITALFLSLLLLLQFAGPVFAITTNSTIYIATAADLQELSKNCSLDTWSKDKKVILKNDISLEGVDFEPIPTFGGIFDGAGFKITGLSITDSYAPSGLFAHIQEGAIVQNVHISGSVTPGGEKEFVGGIAGENSGSIIDCTFTGTVIGEEKVGGIAGHNTLTGTVKRCIVEGEVIGENMTGGIVGENLGMITTCENDSKVNTISVDPHISLDELNAALTVDLSKLPTLDTVTSTNDTGGIAGYSSGMVIGCKNRATIGYQHVGYNVGGIVGRSCGHLANNANSGDIYGRKDVGGIVGQMEPFVSLELSQDLIGDLEKELNELKALVDNATNAADGSNAAISTRLDNIANLLGSATEKSDKLAGQIGEYGDQTITEINRGSEIVAETISQLSDIADKFPAVSEKIHEGLKQLETGLVAMSEASKFGTAALQDMELASDDIVSSIQDARAGTEKIGNGLDSLEQALTVKDKAAVEQALNDILDGLGETSAAITNMSAAVDKIVTLFENAGWTEDALAGIKGLATELDAISDSLSTIHGAVSEIEKNIDVDWTQIIEGADLIIEALGCFSDASAKLGEALALAESGANKIAQGIETITDSVSAKDEAAVTAALQNISTGFSELATATQKASAALSALSDALEDANGLNGFISQFDTISAAIGDLATAGNEAASALTKISNGIAVLSENIEIQPNKVGEGAGLVVGGFEDMSASIGKLQEANTALGSGIDKLQAGLTKLKSAVDVKDEAAIRSALDEIHTALGEIIASTQDISVILSDMADTMEEARIWGESVISACREMSNSFTAFGAALEKIQGGVDAIRNNVAIDFDSAKNGITQIREGAQLLIGASVKLEDAVGHARDALEDMESASTEITKAMDSFASAFGSFDTAAGSITDILYDVQNLMSYLDGVDPLQIQKPSEEITGTANELYADISEIETQLKYLNSEISSAASELTSYVRAINEKFSNIMNTIVDMIYHIESGSEEEIFSDASEADIAAVTTGKTISCENTGYVYGDINVGGITGIIGIEYELDPEDDLSSGVSIARRKAYELKAIVQNCINSGTVVAKKDCVGGVCGKMDLGLVVGCEAYGTAKSESGNYVGGLAGLSAGSVRQSYAKCILSGNKYIGGVTGCGVTEAIISASSKVQGCYTLVLIEDGEQYIGAISGHNLGNYENNFFVSEELAGINRISYSGKAEPITYDELTKIEGLPSRFRNFKLSFVAEGETLYETTFDYGASFDETVFPEMPKKEGNYAKWDRTDLTNLRFDTIVSVIYTPFNTALRSEQTRNDGRAIFYVEGAFGTKDKIIATTQPTLSNGFELHFGEEPAEQWKLSIPNDGQQMHTIRFLTPDGETSGYRVYVKVDGEWKKAEIEPIGSYVTFTAEGTEIEIAVVSAVMSRTMIAVLVIVTLLLIASVIVLIYKKGRKVAKNASDARSENNMEV